MTKENDTEVREGLIEGYREFASDAERERMDQDYDGINGVPPDWIPVNYIGDFLRIRSRLFDVRGYSYKDLVEWLDWFMSEDALFSENDFVMPEKYPNGSPLDSYCLIDEIGFLSWLRWCSRQDKEAALNELAGGFAVKGWRFSSGGSSKKGKEFEPKRSIRRICSRIKSFEYNEVLEAIRNEINSGDTYDSGYYNGESTFTDMDDERIYFKDGEKDKDIGFKRFRDILSELKR